MLASTGTILTLITALVAFAGVAAWITKDVQSSKANTKQLNEAQIHNRTRWTITSGKVIYFSSSLFKKQTQALPKRALTYPPCTLAYLLGFEYIVLPVGISTNTVNIQNNNVIRVECSLVGGSNVNGEQSHTLHELSMTFSSL